MLRLRRDSAVKGWVRLEKWGFKLISNQVNFSGQKSCLEFACCVDSKFTFNDTIHKYRDNYSACSSIIDFSIMTISRNKEKDVMEKNKMMVFAVLAVLVLAVAALTLTNNNGTPATTTGDTNEGNGNTNPEGENEGSSNTGANGAGSIVGNWTFVNGTTNDGPVTHIASGWIDYKADGTWTYFYDYGYTTVNQEGTWQAQDGELYWGTNGSEISDWYSYDTYEIVGDVLIITSDGSEMFYGRLVLG